MSPFTESALRIGSQRFKRIIVGEVPHMRKVEEIEQQIRELSAGEFAELREWFLEQDWAVWDAKIATDMRSGKLDKHIAEAIADYASNRPKAI